MPVACYDLLRGHCRDNWRNDLNGDLWGPKMMLELIFLDKDCEAGRNTLLVYYPKYPLMCEIYAVAIYDSGYSEERTFPRLLGCSRNERSGTLFPFFLSIFLTTRMECSAALFLTSKAE